MTDVGAEEEPASGIRRGSLDARSLIRSASWMSGAHAAAQLSAYGSLLILAHLLPPGSFGTVAAGTAILYIGVVLMDSGTRGSIIVADEISRGFLRRSLFRCFGLGLLLGAVVALASPLLSEAFTEGGHAAVFAVLAVGIPLFALAVVPMAVLQRAMRFRELGAAWATSNFISAVVAVAAGILGAGVWALVARQLSWCGALALLAALRARGHLPRPGVASHPADRVARWFLLFAVTQVLTFNLDYLVIGHQQAVAQLGLYAVAFMIAFTPLQHFSAQVGKVLMAAAAASGPSGTGARTLTATRLMALVLLPLLPVVIVLAPRVLPAILGSNWTGIVVPFELLVAAGIGYSIVNCIGEGLSGAGEMEFRAKLNVGWSVVTLLALVLLVHLDGIRGAALAHLVVFAGYAAAYVTVGTRRIGTDARALWHALAPVIVAVAAQAAVTAGALLGLRSAHAGPWGAAFGAAALGVAAMAAIGLHGERAPLREAFAFARSASQRASA